MPHTTRRKELQAFFAIINYQSKFSPSTEEAWISPRNLTSAKAEWTWNITYQRLFDKVKSITKEDTCIKLSEMKQLYLEIDAFGVGLA